jgi:hypothetical protein
MIDQRLVWDEIWPAVQALIEATIADDLPAARKWLVPRADAADLVELLGLPVLDVLLKTVLGRQRLGLTRAVETEAGRFVYLEYAWPDPAAGEGRFTAGDLVTVQLRPYRGAWRVVDVNPAAVETPMTEAHAQSAMLSRQVAALEPEEQPLILPMALFAGALQLPLREEALADPVLRLLLPGLQARAFGVRCLQGGYRLWRDFRRKATPGADDPAAWAAAAEFVMAEQGRRALTQAAAGKAYGVGLAAVAPRVKRLKAALKIAELDERYSPHGFRRVVLTEELAAPDA